MHRTISSQVIQEAVEKLCYRCNIFLPADIKNSLEKTITFEKNPRARKLLGYLVENAKIAEQEQIAICQDCGIGYFWVEIGQEVMIDGDLHQALQEGMAQAYTKGFLRKSVVRHPFDRINTQNNCPAVVHVELQAGNHLHIYFTPKGAGSENCSAVSFFNPTATMDTIEQWVIDQTTAAAKKACGPLIVGLGIGGSADYCSLLAKKALFRSIGSRNADPLIRDLEVRLIGQINSSGIGPQGLGGDTTVLEVFAEWFPTHIAMLPLAINIQCHAARHGRISL